MISSHSLSENDLHRLAGKDICTICTFKHAHDKTLDKLSQLYPEHVSLTRKHHDEVWESYRQNIPGHYEFLDAYEKEMINYQKDCLFVFEDQGSNPAICFDCIQKFIQRQNLR